MDWQNIYVLALAATVILLLVFEKATLSVLGVALMVAVAVPGLVSEEIAIAGFSQSALVTIAALFIVGEGLYRTGAASMLADRVLQRTGHAESTVLLLVMIMSAVLSAFVNNTLVVVTFLPVITTICQKTGLFPSRLLLPLSYASILGGMCTLVGTSTNLLVSGSLKTHGETPLSMFELTPPGLVMAGVGVLYLFVAGRYLLPKVHSLSTQMTGDNLREYVMEITVGEGSKLIGQPLNEVGRSGPDGKARTMMAVRRESLLWPPFVDKTVEAGDILMVSGPITELSQLQMAESKVSKDDPDTYDPSSMSFFELAISPVSSWVGRRVGDVALKSQFGAAVVALQRSGRHIRERVSSLTLHAGDVLLAFGDERSKTYLRQTDDFHLIEGIDKSIHRASKAPWAFGMIALVIALFVTGLVPVSTAALIGALGMTMTGCLTVRQAQRAVRWPIIFFIAGMFALSKALETTGTDKLIGTWILGVVPDQPHLILAGMMIATIILTEFLTNNAVAVLMVPIALEVATQAHMDSRPLVIAVALGASCCFANPLGYQTNLMVLGPGGYRFRNFIKIGLPLDVVLAITGILVIPLFFPLSVSKPSVRWEDSEHQAIEALAEVASQTPLAVDVTVHDPSYIYIASYSVEHGLLALYPSQGLRSHVGGLPLEPADHRFPGVSQDVELYWPAPAETQAVNYVVVVSDHALPDVEKQLADAMQMGNPFRRQPSSFEPMLPMPKPAERPGRGMPSAGPIAEALNDQELPADGTLVRHPEIKGVYYSILRLLVR